MKIKTHELEGAALDWAVATALGLQLHKDALLGGVNMWGWWISGLSDDPNTWTSLRNFQPSSDWGLAGSIIERERILLAPVSHSGVTENGVEFDKPSGWRAAKTKAFWLRVPSFSGQMPLIAAMRCYVASKLGDEIEVPEELLS